MDSELFANLADAGMSMAKKLTHGGQARAPAHTTPAASCRCRSAAWMTETTNIRNCAEHLLKRTEG